MVVCPNDEVLAALVRRSLDAAEAAVVTSHLDDCPACRQVVVAVVRSKTPIAMGTPSEGLAVMPIAIGQRIGRYVVRNLLGAGGMGSVYEAYDRALDRPIALKVLRPELAGSHALAERLVRESRLMAKVVHPSVITVHDVGREGGHVFIAMELVRGERLSTYVARVRPAWRDIVALCERAGDGLAAAHRAGVVHRDFKPDNVLIETDSLRVVVTDFGVARIDGDAATSREGTPAYMAPEQLRGDASDTRADVFAFAASVWELVFGARPFAGETAFEVRTALATPPHAPAGSPRALVATLERGLALDREERWPDIASLTRALYQVRSRRRRVQVAAGALAFVGIGVAGALAMTAPSSEQSTCSDDALAAAYDARRDRLPASIHATLDPVAAAWRDARRATCGKAVPTACLDARALEIGSFVDDVIADGLADLHHRTIGDPARCLAPAPSLVNASVPADPALRREVTKLRYRVYEAEAARDRADYATALAALPAIITEAAIWPRLRGEALYLLGTARAQSGDVKQAIVTFREAAAVAQTALDDLVAANSWIEMMAITTFDEGDPTRGLEYLTYAEAASERLGRPAKLEVYLQYVKGTTLVEANRLEEAEVALRRALALAESDLPANLGQALQGLGYLYERQGRYSDAVAAYRRAVATVPADLPENDVVFRTRLANNLALMGSNDDAEVEARRAVELADKVFSPEHTDRAVAHQTLAHVLRVGGKLEEALAVARAAASELARVQGPRSLRYGQALTLEGEILDDLGRHAAAAKTIARSCDIIAFEAGDDSAALATCWISQTSALLGSGDKPAALALIDKAVPLMLSLFGSDHPFVASALVTRGIVHARLRHTAFASADLAKAIGILEVVPFDPALLAEARRELAAVTR